MKEKVKKIIRSILPLWIEALYRPVISTFGLDKYSMAIKILLLILPALVAYIASNYTIEDKRRIKYWLPYGLMRDFRKKTYGIEAREGYHSSILKAIRWLLPFGYVLWWDTNAGQNTGTMKSRGSIGQDYGVCSASLKRIEERMAKIQEENLKIYLSQRELADRVEVGLLKITLEIKHQGQ